MERLTKKIQKTIQDKYSLDGYLYYDFAKAGDINKLLNKLGEFEDFMEEQGFEDLNTFRTAINLNQLMNRAGIEYFKENQALKERWEKLKEWVEEFHKDVVAVYPKTLLDKMRELEENND